MDDVISRRAAIDAILHNQEVYSNNFGDDPIDKYTIAIIDNDAQTIAQLPSARPETEERTDESSQNVPNDNLISRKAALDALGGNVVVTSREGAQAVMDYIRGCADRIRSLPSAQPDIARDIATIIENEKDMRVILEQPDNRLVKIIDLMHGTIEHFDYEDAMDLLYQIKDVLNG